jgi:hypothetical protein
MLVQLLREPDGVGGFWSPEFGTLDALLEVAIRQRREA